MNEDVEREFVWWRWTLAWVCYWIGDAFSRMLTAFDLDCYELWVAIWHPPYGLFMRWSSDVQGDTSGPWAGIAVSDCDTGACGCDCGAGDCDS